MYMLNYKNSLHAPKKAHQSPKIFDRLKRSLSDLNNTIHKVKAK